MPGERDAAAGRWQSVLAALQRGYVDALLAGASADAERIIRDAIEAGVPEASIHDEIVAPAMRRIGDLWAEGLIGVGDEHLATEISIRVLALQHEAFRVAAGRSMQRVLLTTVEGERHGVGLNMAASVLVHAGFDTRLLGVDLPMAELAPAVERHRPAVVGLSATTATFNGLLPDAIDEIRSVAPRAGIVVGGAAAPQALAALPGVRLCRHVTDAVEVVDALVQRASLN